MNDELTPAVTVDAQEEENEGEPSEVEMKRLIAELRVQQTDAANFDHTTAVNLEEFKCGR